MGVIITLIAIAGIIRIIAQPVSHSPSNVIQVFVQIFFLDYLWAIVESIFKKDE